MKKKILIIGNGNHHHTLNFTKALKEAKPDFRIDIFDYPPLLAHSGSKAKTPYDNIYPSYEQNLYTKLRFINRLFLGLFFLNNLKKINKDYDVIIIHFISPFLFLFLKLIKAKTKKLIGVIWGSDYLRLNVKEKNRVPLAYNYFDIIVTDSPQLSNELKIEYPFLAPKITTCYFGVMPIEILKDFRNNNITKTNSKIKIGISSDKINISVGHNGSPAQQHLELIDAIKNNLSLVNYKDKIQFVFPLTYGAPESYIESIYEALHDFIFDYKVFTSFLSEELTAHLRNSTDILIHVQTSDAFSGSMKEIFYVGGIVINGAWLKYDFLKEKGVYFKTVNTIQDVSDCLCYCISEFKNESLLAKNNEEIIYNLSSWNKVINSWIRLI